MDKSNQGHDARSYPRGIESGTPIAPDALSPRNRGVRGLMKRPAFQFYPGDWLNDAGLRLCSLPARGLWLEMMCFMHQATPYGHLLIAGRVPNPAELAKVLGERDISVTEWIEELERNEVFSRSTDGVIYSRRMVQDEKNRKQWAKRQRNHRNPNDNSQRDNGVTDGNSHANVTAESHLSSSSSSSSTSCTTSSPKGEVSSASPSPCPHEQIIELYHKHLPELPEVAKWTPTRRGYLQARWREDKRHQTLEWWERFFTFVHKSDYLCGRVKPQPGRRRFIANLAWIITQENFVKILEKNYHD